MNVFELLLKMIDISYSKFGWPALNWGNISADGYQES